MDRIWTLLDASAEAVILYDPAFRFLYLNQAAEQLVGASLADLRGEVLWQRFPELPLSFQEPLMRAMRERAVVTFEAQYPLTGRWTEGRCVPINEDALPAAQEARDAVSGSPALAVYFRDVTERHEAARARAEAEGARERMAFLAEASAVLSSSLDYRVTLDTMAHIVVPELCDWCAVQMPDADGIYLEHVALAHVDPAKVMWGRELNRRYPTRIDQPYGAAQVLRTGEAVFMPEVSEETLAASAQDEEHLRIILGLGFRSAIAVPLIARGRTLGVLLLVTTGESERRLTPEDLTFAQELARRAAIAIDNADLFRQAKQEEERFRALVEATSHMVWRTGADGLIVDMPEWRTYTGQTEDEVRGYGWVEAIHPDDRARVAQVWQKAYQGRELYECDYRVRGRDSEYRWFFARGVPLFHEDGSLREYIGTWANIDAERRAELEQERQLQETRRRAEREALLNRIQQAIATRTEPEEILAVSVREMGTAMRADRCYFAEYDVPGDWARVGADWHRSDLPSLMGSYRLSTLNMDAREMFGGPNGLLYAEDLTDPNAAVFSSTASEQLRAMGLRSILGVALFEEELPVAALVIAMADTPRAWTDDEIALVRAVAEITRSAMEDARLRKREHNIAERLQAALQPAIPGRVPGLDLKAFYRPALAEATIGGDFYDVFSIEKGCFALVVADLSGKGLAAAAQVATVRHMLRALLYQHDSTIAEAVTRLNAMLVEHHLLEGFATLFVGAYDVNQRTLTYVNAGQEPGLILRRETAAVEELHPTGTVLGGFNGAAFEERSVALSPGDVLALFTDGLTEAGTSRKDLLGMPGMISVLRDSTVSAVSTAPAAEDAAEIVARMIAGVEARVTPVGIRDDACLLVGRVE
jgi:PAS domain S-box-containing protein